ncbi:MAG: hypothetical protein RR994_03590, partial [Clostridia bacterium]
MAMFYQYMKEGHYLTEAQYKAVQAAQSEVRNSTFYSALRRTKILPNEQLIGIACEFFNLKRVGNAFHIEVDFTATNKVMGDVFLAIEEKMCVIRLEGKLTFILNDPENEVLRSKATSALGEEPEFALITDAE